MEDIEKTREQLIEELALLRNSVAELQDTNQQRSEKSWEIQAQNYKALFEYCLDGMLMTSPDDRILDANAAACQMFGLTREELCRVGRMADLDITDSRLAVALEQSRINGSWKGELRLKRKDGTTFPAEVTTRIFQDEDSSKRTSMMISDITDRKRVEEALRESEIRYRTLFENMSNAVVIYKPEREGQDFVITDFNEAAAQIEQIPQSEVIGRRLLDVFPGVREFGLFAVFQRVWKTGKAEFFPVKLYKDNRIEGWRENFVYRLPSGELVAVYSDETERKKAEQALKESEEKFRIASDFAYNWEYWIDEDGAFVYMSPSCERITGYSREKFLENPGLCETIVHPEDQAVFKEHQNALHNKLSADPGFIDFRIIDSSGEVHWIEHACQNVVGSTGTSLGRRASQRDITGRKKTEEDLRRRTEELKTVLDAQPAMVLFAHDPECRVITGNRTANEVLGVSPEANVSVTAAEEGLRVDVKRLRADGTEYLAAELPMQRAVATGTPVFDEEIEYRYLDGRQMFIRGNAVPLFDAKGSVRGAVAAFLDITKFKRNEQERENLRAQLFQSQKIEAIRTLAAGIAHDFNNMLQVILGYADLLLLGKNRGQPGYRELQHIIKTTEDARDLVQKIRILSKRADIKTVPLNLNHHVNQAARLLSHSLPKTITLNIQLAEDLAIINADPGLMDQMVMNLAVNAGEAVPDGGTLTIETENIALDDDLCQLHLGVKPGVYVMLTVSDTGKGMGKNTLDSLFDPFYSTKTRDYHKGTGLGLPIVRGIVELHNGYIRVESEVGKGATFRIYIPVLETPKMGETPEEITLPFTGNETILLVEDEDAVRNLGRDILEQFGYKVLDVCDGQEAVEVYEREKANISLVILDIIMPRMDGKQCIRELLRISPEVKVLISSGAVQDETIREVVNLGARGSLRKPFRTRELLEKIRDVLDAD